MVDVKPTGGVHLQLNADGNVHLNGAQLVEELLSSMTLFADHLDQNVQTNGDDIMEARLPVERWLRAHWARYKPHGADLPAWMALGTARGIPA